MKTKHTDGPWEIGISHTDEIAIRNGDGDCIAVACDLLEGEASANAQLIASSPDLLNALELALATIQRLAPPKPYDHTQGTRDVINASISKAKGQQ